MKKSKEVREMGSEEMIEEAIWDVLAWVNNQPVPAYIFYYIPWHKNPEDISLDDVIKAVAEHYDVPERVLRDKLRQYEGTKLGDMVWEQ